MPWPEFIIKQETASDMVFSHVGGILMGNIMFLPTVNGCVDTKDSFPKILQCLAVGELNLVVVSFMRL